MKLIDLSHPLEHGQLNFPLDPKISVVVHNTVASIGYNITQISMSTHQGTHLDAPFHFYDDGKTLDQMRLEQFYGKTTLIDLAPGSALAAKTPLTIERFAPHAEKFQPGAKVILLKAGVEIVIVEGLTHLEQLPETFIFMGFPLNIKGRDGAPIRAVALVED